MGNGWMHCALSSIWLQFDFSISFRLLKPHIVLFILFREIYLSYVSTPNDELDLPSFTQVLGAAGEQRKGFVGRQRECVSHCLGLVGHKSHSIGLVIHNSIAAVALTDRGLSWWSRHWPDHTSPSSSPSSYVHNPELRPSLRVCGKWGSRSFPHD